MLLRETNPVNEISTAAQHIVACKQQVTPLLVLHCLCDVDGTHLLNHVVVLVIQIIHIVVEKRQLLRAEFADIGVYARPIFQALLVVEV